MIKQRLLSGERRDTSEAVKEYVVKSALSKANIIAQKDKRSSSIKKYIFAQIAAEIYCPM